MPRNNARQRLIASALEMFYREGFHAVGLDRIIAEVGVTKTTFYNHFPSKDDLIVAVIEEHGRWWQDMFRQLLRERAGGDDPRQKLHAVFGVLKQVITDDEYRGCMFLNAAVQFPLPHDPAHQASLRNELAMQGIIRDLAAQAGAADPDAFAERFMILMGGALTRHLLTWDASATCQAREMAEELIASLPDPNGQAPREPQPRPPRRRGEGAGARRRAGVGEKSTAT